jgi:hypothetical protein
MSGKLNNAARRIERRAVLELNDDGVLRLAIVADTHSQPHPKTAERIAAIAPHAILHAGDIGAISVLDQLTQHAPVIAVRGNIDEHAAKLPDVVILHIVSNGDSALRLLLMHIAVHGPRIRADAAALATRHDAELIVCGHSHVPFISSERGLTVFNPGSCGPRRFHLPIVFGRIDVGTTVKLAHVSAETGERWLPPA